MRTPPNFGSDTPKPLEPIDVSRRYDLYCTQFGKSSVVYRNVLFKARKALLPTGQPYDLGSEFLEIEQENGESFFIGRMNIIRFYEHGTIIIAEDAED